MLREDSSLFVCVDPLQYKSFITTTVPKRFVTILKLTWNEKPRLSHVHTEVTHKLTLGWKLTLDFFMMDCRSKQTVCSSVKALHESREPCAPRFRLYFIVLGLLALRWIVFVLAIVGSPHGLICRHAINHCSHFLPIHQWTMIPLRCSTLVSVLRRTQTGGESRKARQECHGWRNETHPPVVYDSPTPPSNKNKAWGGVCSVVTSAKR